MGEAENRKDLQKSIYSIGIIVNSSTDLSISKMEFPSDQTV